MAGLGEDKITLQEDWNAQAIYDVILAKFPKLEEGGSFELLKTHEKESKLLHIIYTTIRPFQRDLSLLPEKRYRSYIKF